MITCLSAAAWGEVSGISLEQVSDPTKGYWSHRSPLCVLPESLRNGAVGRDRQTTFVGRRNRHDVAQIGRYVCRIKSIYHASPGHYASILIKRQAISAARSDGNNIAEDMASGLNLAGGETQPVWRIGGGCARSLPSP